MEDVRETPKLTIELVPQTSWFDNVRAYVPQHEWDYIRKNVYEKADNKCEICGGVGPKWPVEAHEVWHYDDEKFEQRLIRLQALCPACHEVKHIGLANINGRLDVALQHMAVINGWDIVEAYEYMNEAFDEYEWRSQHEWDVNISYLEQWLKEIRAEKKAEKTKPKLKPRIRKSLFEF